MILRTKAHLGLTFWSLQCMFLVQVFTNLYPHRRFGGTHPPKENYVFTIPMFDFVTVLAMAYALSPFVEGYRLGRQKPLRPYLETELDFNDPRHVRRPDPEDEDKPPPDAYWIDLTKEASLVPHVRAYLCACAGIQYKPESSGPSEMVQTLQLIPRLDGNGGAP